MGTPPAITEVGMSQRADEDHHLLLLTRAGVSRGEQLPGDLPRQALGDAPHPRVVRGPGRGGESEPCLGVQDEAFRFGPGPSAGPYPGLPLV